jgi:siroheme synthase
VTGRVVLVGAGPGDPELITVKGAKALSAADVVVYDRLAAPALLDLAPGAAERI